MFVSKKIVCKISSIASREIKIRETMWKRWNVGWKIWFYDYLLNFVRSYMNEFYRLCDWKYDVILKKKKKKLKINIWCFIVLFYRRKNSFDNVRDNKETKRSILFVRKSEEEGLNGFVPDEDKIRRITTWRNCYEIELVELVPRNDLTFRCHERKQNYNQIK